MEYGGDISVELTKDIMAVINFYSKAESILLAKERGPFPLFEKSRYKEKEWTLRFCQHKNN